MDKAAKLEAAIREMTKPINGQYPRPWMTNSMDPATARVFTVGKNQRNAFAVERVGSHERYVDALFNRGEETCRRLYERLVGAPSPTRKNTDCLVRKLAEHGVTNVLETNVICYSTPMSSDLGVAHHAGGAKKGRELFRALLEIIEPRVLIVHGAGTVREVGRVLKANLPEPPNSPGEPFQVECGSTTVFIIPSLAPPAWNGWSRWADEHLDAVVTKVAQHVASDTDTSNAWSSDIERLKVLASFLPTFTRPGFVFGSFVEPVQTGDTINFPYVEMLPDGVAFIDAMYRHGWVLRDFDWPRWAQTSEAMRLRDDPTAVGRAGASQLAKLLTVYLRQDRFCEGSLLEAFERGQLTAILMRAKVLLEGAVHHSPPERSTVE